MKRLFFKGTLEKGQTGGGSSHTLISKLYGSSSTATDVVVHSSDGPHICVMRFEVSVALVSIEEKPGTFVGQPLQIEICPESSCQIVSVRRLEPSSTLSPTKKLSPDEPQTVCQGDGPIEQSCSSTGLDSWDRHQKGTYSGSPKNQMLNHLKKHHENCDAITLFCAAPGEFPGDELEIEFVDETGVSGVKIDAWIARIRWAARDFQQHPWQKLGWMWKTSTHLLRTWFDCLVLTDVADAYASIDSNGVSGISKAQIMRFCERIGSPQDEYAAEELKLAIIKCLIEDFHTLVAPIPAPTDVSAMAVEAEVPKPNVRSQQLAGIWQVRQIVLDLYCQLLLKQPPVHFRRMAGTKETTTTCREFAQPISSTHPSLGDAIGINTRNDSVSYENALSFVSRNGTPSRVVDAINFQRDDESSVPASFLIDCLHSSENVLDPLGNADLCTSPFNEYFIDSSHNTYLTGPQVAGISSTQAYARVLLDGCRCVEIDVWDGPDGDPIVTHGHAYCTKIALADVIDVIGRYAFVTSDLPVILSLENHCCTEQQARMASMLRTKLDGLLLTAPLEGYELESADKLPSPALLRFKILLKFKREMDIFDHIGPTVKVGFVEVAAPSALTERATHSDSHVFDRCFCVVSTKFIMFDSQKEDDNNFAADEDSLKEREERVRDGAEDAITSSSDAVDVMRISDMEATEISSDLGTSAWSNCFAISAKGDGDVSVVVRSSEAEHWISCINSASEDKDEPMKFAPELTSLVNYFQAVKIRYNMDYRFNEMSSLKEKTFKRWIRMETAANALNLTARNIIRIYPQGTRLKSSNYDPGFYWNSGCQMVALNCQTMSAPMMMNTTLFRSTGHSGYVRKPAKFRDPKLFPLKNAENLYRAISSEVPADIFVRILCGRFIPTREKPYRTAALVSLESTHDVDAVSEETKVHRSPLSEKNTLCPEYDVSCGFSLFVKDLAFLRIALVDKNDRIVGLRWLNVGNIRSGFRSVQLHDENNVPLATSVLIHIDWQAKSGLSRKRQIRGTRPKSKVISQLPDVRFETASNVPDGEHSQWAPISDPISTVSIPKARPVFRSGNDFKRHSQRGGSQNGKANCEHGAATGLLVPRAFPRLKGQVSSASRARARSSSTPQSRSESVASPHRSEASAGNILPSQMPRELRLTQASVKSARLTFCTTFDV